MPIEDIDEQTYKDYVLHLKINLQNVLQLRKYFASYNYQTGESSVTLGQATQ